MPAPRFSYPISEDVRHALLNYPRIAGSLNIPIAGRSHLEIVRVMGNLHYDHCERLAQFIDDLVPVSGDIGRKVLAAADPFQFAQALAELYLLGRLRHAFGDQVHPADLGPSQRGPDIEVQSPALLAKLEVYTPIELSRSQTLERYVPIVLKYIDAPVGFSLNAEMVDTNNDLFCVYKFQSAPGAWLEDFAEKAADWIDKASTGATLSLPVPAPGVVLKLRLVKRFDDPTHREVTFSPPGKSTDTRLFFEVGTFCDTAKSEWGRKLKAKLFKEQCGHSGDGVLRILVLNFSLADTGWPEFITRPSFHDRFAATIDCLVKTKRPYDVVLPANLSLTPFFGEAVLLDPSVEHSVRQFIGECHLDPPPVVQ